LAEAFGKRLPFAAQADMATRWDCRKVSNLLKPLPLFQADDMKRRMLRAFRFRREMDMLAETVGFGLIFAKKTALPPDEGRAVFCAFSGIAHCFAGC
jgi:hypothetical protein